MEQSFEVSNLARFTAQMADIRISHHPLKRALLFILNETEFDIYQDSHTVERWRLLKDGIVQKKADLFYVQENFGADVLVNDTGDPWVITCTCLGFPRLPMLDDRVLLEGLVYSVSAVKPTNRDSRGVLELLVYPERTDYLDQLAVYGVSFSVDGVGKPLGSVLGRSCVMDVIWGGYPMRMSFDKKTWFPFSHHSELVVPRGAVGLWVQDAEGVTAGIKFETSTLIGGRGLVSENVWGGFNSWSIGDHTYIVNEGRKLYM